MISRKPTATSQPFTTAFAVIQPHLKRRGTFAAVAQEMATARAALAQRDAQADAIRLAMLEIDLRQCLPSERP